MTLEILIIEDDPKHLEDAKQETQRRIDAKEPIKVDYAATFKEAEDLMEKKRYDGIITDIFFPYDDTKRENGPDGWSGIARMECANALEKAKAWPVYPERIPGIVDAFTMWLEGKEMHPTGLMITEKALEEQIPVVMCTDTYHHGAKTQPVQDYAFGKQITLVDCFLDGKEHAETKNWKEAYDTLMQEIQE